MKLRRQFACKVQSGLRVVRKTVLKEQITVFLIQKTKVIAAKPLDYVVPQDGTKHIYVSALNYADVNKKGNIYNN